MPATEQASNIQPADRAVRAAGAPYLLLVVTSIFGLIASQSLIVPHDASATVHNIRSSETLFRLALVCSLIATIAFVFLARELDRLLSSVTRSQASLMVVLVLLSIPISFLSWLNQIAALRLIDGPALSGMGTSQMDGLASFFLALSSDTSALNSIFFGLWLLPPAAPTWSAPSRSFSQLRSAPSFPALSRWAISVNWESPPGSCSWPPRCNSGEASQ
jgi:hypothetical protein